MPKTERQISVVGSSEPVYSGQQKPKWIFHLTSTEKSGIFGIMKTPAVFMCWCNCSMASEVAEIFPLFLDFFQLGRYYRKDIFPILLFGSCNCKRVKRKCRDSVTFQKLKAKITRLVNFVISETRVIIGFYQDNTENRTRCNIGRELNRILSSTSEL